MKEKIKSGGNFIAITIIGIGIIFSIIIIFSKTDMSLVGNNPEWLPLLGIVISIAGILFLIFRAVILWYWRINDVADSLTDMTDLLDDIAKSLRKIADNKGKEKEGKEELPIEDKEPMEGKEEEPESKPEPIK